MNHRRLVPAILVCLSFSVAARSQEWSRFRGPNGTGECDSVTLPAKWTDADYKWKIDLPGEGHSQPVLWGDKLFITSAEKKDATQHIMAYDAASGKPLWKKSYPSKSHTVHQLNTFASSTPCVDADRVYVLWGEPQHIMLVALDHAGEEKWKADFGPCRTQHGFGTSPILIDNLVIVGNDQGDEKENGESSLIAVDKTTGKEKWRTPRKTREMAYSTPCIWRAKPDGPAKLIFTSGAHGFTCVNPADGKIEWELDTFDKRTCSSPIIAGGLIFGSCGNGAGGGNYVIAIRPPDGGDRSAPEIAYKMAKAAFAPYVPGFVAKEDKVFLWADRGYVSCLEAGTGKAVWQQNMGGTFYGSPIRVRDKIYCIEARGNMVVLEAGDKYKQLAKVNLGQASNSTPAVANNTMYLRTLSKLMALPGEAAK